VEREGFALRITGGRFAGRTLRVPKRDVRPTADRVRESLFARLGDLAGKRVLDLFAGSGALGFEALSRGALHVTFVDRSNAALEVVRANASALGVTGDVALRRGEALAFLSRLRAAAAFDLVFVDPPYAGGELPRALARLAGACALAPGALVVAESDRRHPPGPIEGLAAIDERRYGDTLITWWVPGGPGAAGPEASDA
jgi:16S rRNA (guanine966-N2)-methyltransferase